MVYFVNNSADFIAALEGTDNNTNVVLTGSFTTTATAQISDGKTVTLASDSGGPHTVTSSVDTIKITNGMLEIGYGVELKNTSLWSMSAVLLFQGPLAKGKIMGGLFEANTPLRVLQGATITQISDGDFIGTESAVFVEGNNSKIDLISDGLFRKTDASIDRSAVYLDNNAQIMEISGGTFETNRNSCLLLIRGGFIHKISGGTFTSQGSGTRAIHVWADGVANTGIDLISGGHFKGDDIAIWLYGDYPQITATVNQITGGTIEAVRGLHVDIGSSVGKISGGKFIGPLAGIYCVSKIGSIDGDPQISGIVLDHVGVYYGQIGSINGGTIISELTAHSGITNLGIIDEITGGTIVGLVSAINSSAGKIGKITSGVFLGETDVAIKLGSPTLIEPGLNTDPGNGRYWGKDGVIFNDESLAIYPQDYFMSTTTLPVPPYGEFKYLTKGGTPPEPKPGCIQIIAQKVSTGALMPEGKFEFGIFDENNDLVVSSKNRHKSCHAKIVFPEICYKDSGVFKYKVREITASDECWKTDKREYNIIVTVTKDANGDLIIKVEYPDGQPKFENQYCPPKKCCCCNCCCCC
ncbi:MAG: hypothetical protein LBG88_04460 [Christensenellaceae bacterium]|jgi:pilin isopeptide linkage protein|nr:hypothetical protein [Christensenellaceae bacterium]